VKRANRRVTSPGNRVGFHGDDGHAAHKGREQRRAGDIAAQAEHGRRAPAPQNGGAARHRSRQLPECPQRLPRADALEAADVNEFHREAAGGGEARFKAAPGSDEETLVSARAQLGGNRQQRHDVASGAATRHDETQTQVSDLSRRQVRGGPQVRAARSLTLSSMPHSIKVQINELPP
jgi:hypothetical protein